MATLTKKPIQVYLRQDQVDALRVLSGRKNVSMSKLIRKGVDYILNKIPEDEDPLWDIVGLFDSGLGDLAENHDEYIVKTIKEGD